MPSTIVELIGSGCGRVGRGGGAAAWQRGRRTRRGRRDRHNVRNRFQVAGPKHSSFTSFAGRGGEPRPFSTPGGGSRCTCAFPKSNRGILDSREVIYYM